MIAGLRDQAARPPKGIWNSLNRILGTLIVLMGLMVVLYRFIPETSTRKAQAGLLASLDERIVKEEQQLIRLEREADLLTRDPEFIALHARERLDLVAPGEKVYRLDQQPSAPSKPKKGR